MLSINFSQVEESSFFILFFSLEKSDETYRPGNHWSLTGHFDGFSSGGIAHKLIVRRFCYRLLAEARGRGGQIRSRTRSRNIKTVPIVFLVQGKGGNEIGAKGRRQEDRGEQGELRSHCAAKLLVLISLLVETRR